MIDAGELERGCHRWLRWYPQSFRREHEAEILAVLMAGAGEGQRRPELVECLDLVRGGLWMRLRPRVPWSDRSVFDALRLMCLGATLQLLAAITLLAPVDDVRSSVAKANPGLTEEWSLPTGPHAASASTTASSVSSSRVRSCRICRDTASTVSAQDRIRVRSPSAQPST